MQVLNIIMRTDMDSMNAGKGMAQSNHVYGALKKAIRANDKMRAAYLEWMAQTEQEFGTTIVRGANEKTIQLVLDGTARRLLPVVAGWVHDPEYPVRDGEVTHLIPVDTCAFVFGEKEDCDHVCGHLTLHS